MEKNHNEYTNPTHIKFVGECLKAGWPVHYYHGRNFYKGPAVIHSNVQEVIRQTSMELVYDNMGKSDYVIYPK